LIRVALQHDVQLVLLSVGGALIAAVIGARATLAAGDRERDAEHRRELDAAKAEFYAAATLMVALLRRMPNVDPSHPFHRASAAVERAKEWVVGPTVGWVQTEKQLRQVLGSRPFTDGERYVEAAARLRVLTSDPTIHAAIDRVSEYIIELSESGNADEATRDQVLALWPDVHTELTAAVVPRPSSRRRHWRLRELR
jgi:hypothetical protein